MTIEGPATGTDSGPEISVSQGFLEGFPSPTPAAEVGESSGIGSLLLVITIIVVFVISRFMMITICS